jgi:hypothetical protein
MMKSDFLLFQGIENIYTQHQPYLVELLDQLVNRKLRDTAYPYVQGCQATQRFVYPPFTYPFVAIFSESKM